MNGNRRTGWSAVPLGVRVTWPIVSRPPPVRVREGEFWAAGVLGTRGIETPQNAVRFRGRPFDDDKMNGNRRRTSRLPLV